MPSLVAAGQVRKAAMTLLDHTVTGALDPEGVAPPILYQVHADVPSYVPMGGPGAAGGGEGGPTSGLVPASSSTEVVEVDDLQNMVLVSESVSA
jgi:hypothetical protein